MEFYRDVLGGDLDVSTFGDFGTEGPDAGKVMHHIVSRKGTGTAPKSPDCASAMAASMAATTLLDLGLSQT